jgi:aminoglycoside phosphotransferase (APT) family kinase protein
VPEQSTTPEVIARETAVVIGIVGAGARVVYEDEGWDSRVYLVDGGAAVFKFPRSSEVRDRYETEIAFLRALEPLALPVWTPRVRWTGPDLSYFGYEGLPGATPTADTLAGDAARIGDAIGGFARVLHAQSPSGLRKVTIDDEVARLHARWDAAAPIVAEHFDGDERARLDAYYRETLPAALRRLGGDPRPCHGDLGPWNLVLADDGRIGVIDFGDVAIVDRSLDLCGLDHPVAFEAALAAYGEVPGLREKAAWRAAAALVMDLLFFAGKQDPDRMGVCVERVRRIVLDNYFT